MNPTKTMIADALRRFQIEATPAWTSLAAGGDAPELDHIEPLWRGGRDDESNFQGLCRDCHAAKTAREAAERCSPDRWA